MPATKCPDFPSKYKNVPPEDTTNFDWAAFEATFNYKIRMDTGGYLLANYFEWQAEGRILHLTDVYLPGESEIWADSNNMCEEVYRPTSQLYQLNTNGGTRAE